MAKISQRILEDARLPGDLLPYALATRMTGLVLMGKGPEAMEAFFRYGRRIGAASSWQPVFRFLVGQAGEAVPGAGAGRN